MVGKIYVDGIPGGAAGLADFFAKMHLDKMRPDKVPLKNKPQPYKGPDPKVTISYPLYPHIMDHIISHSKKPVLLALRATCKAICKRVDREFANHIEVQSDGLNLQIQARWLGRIPSIRFKGEITIGASFIPRGVKHATQAEAERFCHQQMVRFAKAEDVWLRVAPESVPWLNEFMKDVVHVDMDGSNMIAMVPLSHDAQIGKDPYGRVFVDPYPVSLIRMYPDGSGQYSAFVPFTSRWIGHSIQLADPDKPASKTWLHNTPHVPEGTEQLRLTLHLHPDLPPNLSVSGDLKYPSSLKRVTVELTLLPVNGVVRPTANAFNALNLFWVKIFAHFRPGIEFFIYNIHQFDPIQHQLLLPTREYVAVLFCNIWLGLEPAPGREGLDKLWETARPHIKFLRGQARLFDLDANLTMHTLTAEGAVHHPNGSKTIMTPNTVLNADGTSIACVLPNRR